MIFLVWSNKRLRILGRSRSVCTGSYSIHGYHDWVFHAGWLILWSPDLLRIFSKLFLAVKKNEMHRLSWVVQIIWNVPLSWLEGSYFQEMYRRNWWFIRETKRSMSSATIDRRFFETLPVSTSTYLHPSLSVIENPLLGNLQ